MNVPALIEKMLVLFFAMAAGFVCGKRGWLDDAGNRTISKLVVMLTNPMLALSSVMGKERLMSNQQVLMLTVIGFALLFCCMGLSRAVVRLLHVPEADRGLMRFCSATATSAAIGYPIVQALFGMDASFYVTVIVLCSQLLMWSYGVHLVSGHGKFHVSWSIFKNHCLIASLTAYTIYLTGLKVPDRRLHVLVYRPDDLAADHAHHGKRACPDAAAEGLYKRKALYDVRRQACHSSGLRVFLLRALGVDSMLLGVIVVVLCIPSATNATNIAYLYGGNHELASSGVMLSTLFSMVTMPLLMHVLFG